MIYHINISLSIFKDKYLTTAGYVPNSIVNSKFYFRYNVLHFSTSKFDTLNYLATWIGSSSYI